MDKNLYETLEILEPLIEEMGLERLEKYMYCYASLKLPKDNFYFAFKDYIQDRKRISINSFKIFLLEKSNPEFIDIMKKVQEYNQ